MITLIIEYNLSSWIFASSLIYWSTAYGTSSRECFELSVIACVISICTWFTDWWNVLYPCEYYLLLWFVDQLDTSHLFRSFWYCRWSLVSFPFALGLLMWNFACPREYYHLLWFIDQLDTADLLGCFWDCRWSLVSNIFLHGKTDHWMLICPREYYLLLWFIDQLWLIFLVCLWLSDNSCVI